MAFSEELRFGCGENPDQIQSVDQVLQRQNVAHRESISWDVIGLAWAPERAVICLIQMRRGRIVRALPTTLEHGGATEDEVLPHF